MAEVADADTSAADEVETDRSESPEPLPRPFEPPQWLKDRGMHSC